MLCICSNLSTMVLYFKSFCRLEIVGSLFRSKYLWGSLSWAGDRCLAILDITAVASGCKRSLEYTRDSAASSSFDLDTALDTEFNLTFLYDGVASDMRLRGRAFIG
eukprot:NODE_197_length_15379_cov_0.485602.p10 type:complete len:106 gc:universal NODE_197_length_15379_cov_0.485602:14136-14453(+)